MRVGYHLFLFYDGIEEILVSARNKHLVWEYVERLLGEDIADSLILASFLEYPDQYEFVNGRRADYVANELGPCVITSKPVGTYPKPYPAWTCEAMKVEVLTVEGFKRLVTLNKVKTKRKRKCHTATK